MDRIRDIIRICLLIKDTQTKPADRSWPSFTSNLRVIAFCCTRQAEPLISTATRQTFDLDPTLTSKQGKRQLTVMSKHDFEHLTLTFDLRPWPTIPAYSRSRSASMPKIKVKGQTVLPWELWQTNKQTNTQTHGRTDGRYQVHYLPRFAVDNYWPLT